MHGLFCLPVIVYCGWILLALPASIWDICHACCCAFQGACFLHREKMFFWVGIPVFLGAQFLFSGWRAFFCAAGIPVAAPGILKILPWKRLEKHTFSRRLFQDFPAAFQKFPGFSGVWKKSLYGSESASMECTKCGGLRPPLLQV